MNFPCFMRTPRWYLALTLWAVLSSPLGLFAQVDQGAITGTVKDIQGAVVPRADVKLTNVDTNFELGTQTDNSGVYTFQPVKVGHYSLQVSAPGFATTTRTGIELQINQRQGADITLKPGARNESVDISGDAVPLLQSEDASTGQIMMARQINDTPLPGRNYVFMAQLAPGVAPANGSRGQGNGDFNANGQRTVQNNFILDGVDNNSSSIDILNGASYVVKPPPDALQEVKVQTGSFNAEFGHSAGAVVNASLKSGTNQVHGNAWEYLRNEIFNAHDYVFPLTGNIAPTILPKPKYRQNEFGGTLGGPVLRNKLFVFGDYEGNRIRFGNTAVATVPTLAMRKGDFSELLNPVLTGQPSQIRLFQPGTAGTIPLTCTGQPNVLCPNQIDPVAQKILNMYPLPNTNGNFTFRNYTTQRSFTDDTNQFDIRVDWIATQKDQAFSRFSYSHEAATKSPILGPILDGSGTFDSGSFLNYGQNFALSETHIFSPRLSNELRFGYNWGHFAYLQPSYLNNVAPTVGLGGIPFGPLNGGLPSTGIGGINGFGTPAFQPSNEFENVYQILDNLTRISGNHAWKFGVSGQNIRYATLQPTIGHGGYNFSGKYTGIPGTGFTGFGVADFLTNNMASANLSSLDNTRDGRWLRGTYAQDDWKVTSNLTVNLGLRYEFAQPAGIERNDHQAIFYPTSALTPGSGAGVYILPNSQKNVPLDPNFIRLLAKDNIQLQFTDDRALIQSQKTNFAPRLGISLRATDRLVVRTGFGIFYGGVENLGNFPNLGVNYPYDIESNYQSGGCGVTNGVPVCPTNGLTLEGGFAPGKFATPSLRGADPKSKTPYSISYNLSVQQALANNMTATIGYVGSQTRHLQIVVDPNAPAALVAPSANSSLFRAFPDFGGIGYITDAATANYNSLQATLDRRFSKGLTFQSSYTYSHALDNSREPLPNAGEGGYRAYPIFGIAPDYSNSPFDTRHRFTFLGNYEPPFGAQRRFFSHSTILNTFIGGWSSTLIFRAQTGQPFTIGNNNASANGAGAHAILEGDPFAPGGTPNPTNPNITCPSKVRTVLNWYNPCAFGNPPNGNTILPGQIITGQAAIPYLGGRREQLYGPGYERIDLSLFKNFSLIEKQYLQFRADIFNLFNTPAFGTPNSGIASNGGQITSTRSFGNQTPNARFIQLALKYYF